MWRFNENRHPADAGGRYRRGTHIWEPMEGISLSKADEPQYLAEFLEKNADTCFVACIEKKVIGTVLGGSDGRRGYIYHLAVDPKFQRQGIGRSLLNQCLNAFRQAGIQKCHIFIVHGNQQGQDFWQAAGWIQREDIFLMSKDL